MVKYNLKLYIENDACVESEGTMFICYKLTILIKEKVRFFLINNAFSFFWQKKILIGGDPVEPRRRINGKIKRGNKEMQRKNCGAIEKNI